MVLQGGCLCGRVRYTINTNDLATQNNFCHCRKCQKACGAPVAAFFTVQQADVKFEGKLGVYQSSDKAVRKFCENCGTPLVFQNAGEATKTDELDINTTTLDEPDKAPPAFHIWMESKRPWLELADKLPKYKQSRSD